MQEQFKAIQGGIVAPHGFAAAGVCCGIKTAKGKNDLALIVSECDASAAGVFTTNVAKAHCVISNQERIKSGLARAIVVNSGNANACNGERGAADVERMTQLVAQLLKVDASRVLSASTGVIGHFLPMDKVETGIKEAASKLHGDDGSDVTQAIMTTDTYPKEIAIEFEMSGTEVHIGAIAKGSGMIAPNMATMLCFVTTDVAVAAPLLQEIVRRVVESTFNAITVDGDTSTNDMCLVLANGKAGNPPLNDANNDDFKRFEQALHHVCLHLAKEIARDGEGATKLVEVVVKNAHSPRQIAMTIANSPLVKTALFGNDPNWGRILAAAGRSGVKFDPAKVEITLADTTVFANGAPTAFDAAMVSAQMKAKEIQVVVDLHQPGGSTASVYTCDFSYDYIKINADYHT